MQNEDVALLPEVVSILEALLVQAERPERKRVVRVHFNKQNYSWYFSGEEPGLRGRIHEQLQDFVTTGWLKLNWKKYERGNILESIDLIAGQEKVIDDLCAILGRVPLKSQRAALMALLTEQESCGGWFDSFLSWAIAQVKMNKSPSPLSLSDLESSRDLLRSLCAIAKLGSPTLERILSVGLFGNSKRLEELRGAIVTVLRTFAPDASVYEDDEWALLQAHNVYRPPEYTPIVGSLSFLIGGTRQQKITTGTQLHLGSDLPSIALSEDILRTAVVISCSAKALITVENRTSFSELLLVRPASVVVVFTGGFASPGLIRFLRSIRACRPELPVIHWGDMDAGGLRILAHLRRHLGNVLPVCMDVETFEVHRASAQTLTSNDKVSMDALLAVSALADCHALIHCLAQSGLKLEQESIRATYVLSTPTVRALNAFQK